MPSRGAIERFLSGTRIAFVGASRDSKKFNNAVYRHLRTAGYTLLPVHPSAGQIEGDVAYAALADVPDPVDGVLVMVPRDAALDVLRECAARGVKQVWLHRGLGSPGAMSDAAVAYCDAHGLDVVAGACPLMFVPPVRHMHWLHRQLARRSMTP